MNKNGRVQGCLQRANLLRFLAPLLDCSLRQRAAASCTRITHPSRCTTNTRHVYHIALWVVPVMTSARTRSRTTWARNTWAADLGGKNTPGRRDSLTDCMRVQPSSSDVEGALNDMADEWKLNQYGLPHNKLFLLVVLQL